MPKLKIFSHEAVEYEVDIAQETIDSGFLGICLLRAFIANNGQERIKFSCKVMSGEKCVRDGITQDERLYDDEVQVQLDKKHCQAFNGKFDEIVKEAIARTGIKTEIN